MKEKEILETFEMLARSQGFYGRLLRDILELKENDFQEYKRNMKILENEKFKNAVDLVLFIEC